MRMLLNCCLMWLLRLLNRWGWRRDTMLCMHKDDVWRWPDYLGKQIEGNCDQCGDSICYEEQNAPFYKICNRCYNFPVPN